MINGVLTVVVMGLCSVYTTLMLLKSKKLVEHKTSLYNLTYVDVGPCSAAAAPAAAHARRAGPGTAARFTYGNVLAVAVYGLMLLASLGVAASYLVFIGAAGHLAAWRRR